MTPLSPATLDTLPAAIERPRHRPGTIGTGIVHFGPGAFHRAHQAAYIDRLLDQDPRWGIAAVSLRSPGTVEALNAQGGLYTLGILDREPAMRVLGAHTQAIGPGEGARLASLLGDPGVRIVSTTVTEKGYCLASDGSLDFDHPDIVADMADPAAPASVLGWIVAGLRARRAAGQAPFAVLCCDNMTGNGGKLRAACVALAGRSDRHLADWIAGEVAFPDSMVDSITPASDAAFLAKVEGALGVRDRAAVQREAFAQWVIARFDLKDGPDLASVGVTMTDDVRGYEQAKLRVLNGTHSTLAYLGLALGHESVFDAMSDDSLAGFVTRMAHEDIVPSLPRVAGLDTAAYADAVLARYRNPAIRHLLSQIAWDGSQKLPYRLLDTAADALDAGRPVDRIATAVAAWIGFVRRKAEAGETITDPLAETLVETVMRAEDAAGIAAAMLAMRQVFPARLAEDDRFSGAVAASLGAVLRGDVATLLSR